MNVSLDDVLRIRANLARAHALAAQRFRDLGTTDWRVHLELQAAALLETAEGVVADGPIRYDIDGTVVTPRLPQFTIRRRPAAVFEYWMLMGELLASPTWAVTRVIATPEEYDEALKRMRQPQIVRSLVARWLPSVEFRGDDTASLEVTVYTRAGEERVERRQLILDQENELHFHSRELIAEGRGGVNV